MKTVNIVSLVIIILAMLVFQTTLTNFTKIISAMHKLHASLQSPLVQTHFSGWKREDELPIKPARSSEGGVNGINPVCGPNHHHLPAAVQAIHEC